MSRSVFGGPPAPASPDEPADQPTPVAASTTSVASGDKRFVVGIDLGTTNSVLAYVDTAAAPDGEEASRPRVQMLRIPQLVRPGIVEERATLPSFLYLASPSEFAEGALDLPAFGHSGRRFAAGELARDHGWQTPMRLVSSAKSWLSHAGVDRTAPILPAPAVASEPIPAEIERISPLTASTRYLEHLRDAWDALVARGDAALSLSRQDVLLTVPASFDAVARELTVRAAEAAGLQVTLLEEPQAAFYSWLGQQGDAWRKLLRVGDLVLVCDVGGGTTDFSLIAVRELDGNLALERVAVGEHILLGGDNMDLALAATLRARLAEAGTRLDAWQFRSLVHACREAKEALLIDDTLGEHPVTLLGRGRSVIGGAITTPLTREDVDAVLLEGFFPLAERQDRPRERKRGGLQELGLPYAADAAVTRHLAKFVGSHDTEAGGRITAVLFNGGVMKGHPLRSRIIDTIGGWWDSGDLAVLDGTDFDLAVAHGAACYGLSRRGRGVRIRGGTARAYYVGVEAAMPAVPGMEPPLRAICVAPAGMEEGSEAEVAPEGGTAELGLVVGERAEFQLLSSTTRKGDRVGTVIEEAEQDPGIVPSAPLEATLAPRGAAVAGQLVPVRLRSRVSEIGTLEVWCEGRDGERWKLEFDVRGR